MFSLLICSILLELALYYPFLGAGGGGGLLLSHASGQSCACLLICFYF